VIRRRASYRCTTIDGKGLDGRRGLVVILLSFIVVARLALGAAYCLLQPPLESHDETGHAAYVDHIAQDLTLPEPGGLLTPYFDEGHQPPLYYVVPGLVGHLLGLGGQYQPPMNPFFLNGDGSRGVNAAVHVPSVEAFPWHGGLLLLHIARFWSVLLGGVAVLLTYLAGRLALPGRPWVALAGAAIAAFVPTALGVTDAVTNDALVPVTFGLSLLTALAMLRSPTVGRAVWFGVAVGLSLLTKNSALALLPFAVFILVLAWWPKRRPPALVQWGSAFFASVVIVAGWWYLRNRLLFGHWITDRTETSDIINNPAFKGTAVLHSASGSFVGRLVTYTFRSFWALIGWGTLGAPDRVYDVLLAFTLLCLVGLVWLLVSAVARRRAGVAKTAMPPSWRGAAVLAVFFLVMLPEPLYRAIYYEAPTLVPGRYLFGAIGAVGLLLALGLSAFARRLPALLAVPGVALAALSLWLLPNVVVPAYAAPAPIPIGATVPNPVDVVFGSMHLIGYRVDEESVPPGGIVHVTLYWRALRPMATSYTVGVHVVDAGGRVLGGVDGLPGRGNLGTPLWQVGPTYADPYELTVAADAPMPQMGRLVVGVEQQVLDPQPNHPGYLRPIALAATDSAGHPLTPFLGRFRIGEPVTAQGGVPQYRLGADLGLVSIAIVPPAAGADTLQVRLRLRALRAPLSRLVLFAHLLGPDGKDIGGADVEPLDGHYPTDLWPAGETVDDTLTIKLPSGVPTGTTRLEIGAYPQGQPQSRLPVIAADGTEQPDAHIVVPVRNLP
jgi:4-amino-4-deoxy-L-arabinose transferase-like glycosyltransferase